MGLAGHLHGPLMPFPDCPRTLSMAMRVSTHLQTKFLTERSLLEFQLPKEPHHSTLTNQNKNTTLITHTKSATSKFLSFFNQVGIGLLLLFIHQYDFVFYRIPASTPRPNIYSNKTKPQK